MEGGQVRVQISLEDGMFVLRVKDQGIGMPEEVLQHTGERFYRGSSIYEFDYEGLGLGLHISQAIIRLHQGSVQFNSEPKLGTIATLQFPQT
jgi:signal transduction histidine kinase